MKRILLLFLFSVIFVPVDNAQRKANPLTKEDKAAIIKATIIDSELFIGNTFNGDNKEIIYLSTKNIASVKLPKFNGLNLIFVSAKQIKVKAKKGICYGEFEEFTLEDSKVSIKFVMKCIESGGVSGYSGNSFHTFRKVKGQWVNTDTDGLESKSYSN